MLTKLSEALSAVLTMGLLRDFISVLDHLDAASAELRSETEFKQRREHYCRKLTGVLHEMRHLFPPDLISACAEHKVLTPLTESLQRTARGLQSAIDLLEPIDARLSFSAARKAIGLSGDKILAVRSQLATTLDDLTESLDFPTHDRDSPLSRPRRQPEPQQTGLLREPDGFPIDDSRAAPVDLDRLGVETPVVIRNEGHRLPDRFPAE